MKTERFISQDKRRVTSSGDLRLTESLLSILRSDCHQGTLYCEGQSQGVGFGRNGVGAEALESVFKARKPKAVVSRK